MRLHKTKLNRWEVTQEYETLGKHKQATWRAEFICNMLHKSFMWLL